MQLSFYPNRYSGKCSRCGSQVFPNEGLCFHLNRKWVVSCRSCHPLETAQVYAAKDAVKATQDLARMDLEERRIVLVAERQALANKFYSADAVNCTEL